ncbi:adenosine deaminase-like [Patiria miniata]|uniref:Adenosine deaminase n=1 Tax=Patiria miniata TaxID=46514 RepID=A0A913ZLN9_PATMI|nr:adenosine deaminase-like [Patiria miniata]
MSGENRQKSSPKVELHIHLDGAVRASTVWELAKKRGVEVPGSNPEELAHIISSYERGDLFSFLKAFGIFTPTIVADKDAIRRIAYELCEDKANEGVVYLEMRISPHLLANAETSWYQDKVKDVLSTREVMASIVEGLEVGQRDFNIKVRLIVSTTKQKPEWAAECLQLCKEFSPMTVAMDIGGIENMPLDPAIIKAFQEAERCGIHRTIHAGEDGPTSAGNVKEAIELLKAERIGHGYHVLQDESIYQMVKDLDIHLEVCPTSSVYTGSCDPDYSKHPGVRFTKDKINFSLNTDDPLVFRNTINDEFEIAKKYFGLTDQAAIQVTLNAARSAFLPEQEKLELIQQLRAAYNLTNE